MSGFRRQMRLARRGCAHTVADVAPPITIVDAFTDRAFAGNPAAVCLLATAAPEEWMQAVAAEMNLSETAFVVPRSDGDHDLRWFTPTTEVDLCGHATLASAHVLGRTACFHTRGGTLTCRPGAGGTIEMDFPAIAVDPTPDPPDWATALGLSADRVAGVFHGNGWVLVELAAAGDVRSAVPDRQAIFELGGGVAITACPGERDGIDMVSRVFVPGSGIDEDPVTGSAHCMFAAFWAPRLGRTELIGEQASKRGGIVHMRLEGQRVVLSGNAVTVLTGELAADPPAP